MTDIWRAALRLFLKRLASRSILTEEEERALLGLNGTVKEVAANADFVRLGEKVDHSCLVVEGLVGRFGQTGPGDRQITCLYIPGDMADLPSVVNPKSAWGLSALTRTTIVRVPHHHLQHTAAMYPGIAEAFWRDCVADGSIFSEWVVNVGRRDAIARLAHLFCEMAIRCELAGQGDRHSFLLPITQSGLGDATGLTSVHVNRTLKELRERAIATVGRSSVQIHNWNQLVSIGDFDRAYLLLERPTSRVLSTQMHRSLGANR